MKASASPILYEIPHGGEECLYEVLEADEHVTMSVFITSGTELKGVAKLEGPIASITTKSTEEIYQSSIRADYERVLLSQSKYVDKSRLVEGMDPRGILKIAETVDFEHAEYLNDYWFDDDEEYEKHLPRLEGDPFQKTVQVVHPGWYRVCVKSWYRITAEIQLRKSSELGLDQDSKHVTTYEERAIKDEEGEIEEDAAKEEDLDTAKNQVRTLHRLLSSIMEKQESERRRLEVHKSTNEHSHSRMVLNSLMETVLFCFVTGFQVYTVRKWFQGDPLLG